ncbi:MAG: hypothetical protein M0R51_17070 [Clostridia bacterium]|jgi:hypothetical protein|nr:hypothetical protein [Clostridia bacterium]
MDKETAQKALDYIKAQIDSGIDSAYYGNYTSESLDVLQRYLDESEGTK